ncbi:efflux RND transporter permease subunit [Paraglaciecola hydrolytica]|uniref:RND transporter n=1 Tax=Paraglaciecola hydrolytica TaxID=1799789 RepID=A0A148KMU2_9ALTE|nr:MMPL family transporter [Paraglaciecola hydrolytica]KXI27644.1 RND transporter [Paraglaciecola hydrolytica]
MNNSLLSLSVTRPKRVLLIGFMIVVLAAIGGKSLYFRGDYKVFFAQDNPELQAFEQMQNSFSKNESASIIIAPHSGEVFNPQTLSLIRELTEESWQTPFSSRVDSLSNFQYIHADEDDLIVEDLVDKNNQLATTELLRIRQVALSEPDLVGRMVSPQGHVTMISITVNLPEGDQTAEVEEITAFVKAMTDKYKLSYPEHDFYHTGVVLMNDAFAASAKHDASTLVPLMFATIIIIMWLALRTFVGTFATVIVIVGSIATTMGLSGWMNMFLSTATVNVPTMVMTLAVADCIHVVSSMLFAMREGKDKKDALLYSLQLNVKPIFITSATTGVGFLTLNFAEVPILADLGNLTAIGVIFACLFSLTLLPALIMLLPMKSIPVQKENSGRTEKFGEWVINNHRRLLPVSLLVAVVAVFFAFQNQLNDVATAYFEKSSPFRQSTDFQQENLSGMTNIDFAIYTEQESGINAPEILMLIENFSQWLRTQPEVDHVVAISETFKRLNKNMHRDDPAYYVLPDDKELAAQYLLLYEMSLPYGLDLNNQMNTDKSATRIVATVQNLGSKELTGLESRAKDWFTQRAPELTVTAASPGLMFAHIGEANMASMIEGTAIALLLISGLLVFALKSWRMGVISLLPNLLPAGIGFGIWGIYSGEINLGLSIVLSMTLGIIVDDTVHFLSKYQYARTAGKDAEQAVRFAFASVGRALWITTIVLALGFSVLMLSPFALNADMGMLTSIIILVALAVDFLFLPPFLMIFDKKTV